MHPSKPIAVVFLCCLGHALAVADARADARADAPPVAVQAPAPAPSPAVNSPSAADNDAAARHARRTACLKEAKSRKLLGDQKAAFLKGCIAG